jgi:hypothetical protein
MHWILANQAPASHKSFFTGIRNALAPSGVFVFEMGGLGNVSEMRTALLLAVGRQVGLERAKAVDPWFFPDEGWMRHMLEAEVGGFKIERIEREWRPTIADKGGVEGWIRLFGSMFLEEIKDEAEREECIKEVADVLRVVCAVPGGGESIGYVRLRCIARKI